MPLLNFTLSSRYSSSYSASNCNNGLYTDFCHSATTDNNSTLLIQSPVAFDTVIVYNRQKMLSKPHKQCDDNSQCYRQTIVLQEVSKYTEKFLYSRYSNNTSDFATFFATFSAFYTTIVSNHSAFIATVEKAVVQPSSQPSSPSTQPSITPTCRPRWQ